MIYTRWSFLCAPTPFCWGRGRGGVEPPTKFSIRGGGNLTEPQLFEGIAGKDGDPFIDGWLEFSHKNKSEFEIFNSKKSF